MKKLILLGFAALCAIGLFSCASAPRTKFIVSISGFSTPESNFQTKYILVPGLKDVEESDLEFQEYAAVAQRALQNQGFVRVDNLKEANLVIFFSYSIGEPTEQSITRTIPTFGQTGVSSSTTYGTIRSNGAGGTTYSGTTYNTPTFGITGYSTRVDHVITYLRLITLDGMDITAASKGGKMKPLWKTTISSSGTTNDMRRIVPVMLQAAYPYLGTNTGRTITVEFKEGDAALAGFK